MDNIVASIGLDWADERHSVHLQPGDGRIEHLELEQKPAVLHEWVAQLQQRFGGGKIAVALEQRKGAVIHALLMYDCFVLYPINPKALARYREAFSTSGAKDDPLDSELLLDLVVRHRDTLRAWVPDTVERRKLQALCEQRRKLVNQRVALTNRLTSLLKQYFPQALEWVGDLASVQACDFLTQWPTLADIQAARRTTVRRFYQDHNCRKRAVIDARLAAIAGARPLTTDAAVIEPLGLAVQTYAAQLRTLLGAIQTFNTRIAAVFAQHTDSDIFGSFPGAGDVCAPRLAAAFGTDRSRWDSAAELQAHSGIAPVTERSGKTVWVHHRLACPKFVKQTFHEFADQSIRFSTWARAYYDQQRARGNDHHAALRALAYKWIRILFRCWKERRPYDEATYIDALRRRGSIRSRVAALKDALGTLPVTALERTDTIEDFKREYGKTRSLAAVNRTLGILRHAMNWGRGRTPAIFSASPFHRFGVKIKSKGETKRDRRVALDEEQRLLAAADKLDCAEHAFAGAPMRDRIIGALETGCRLGEMLKIQNRHVFWNTHQISIPAEHAKDAESRRIPFEPKGRLAQLLKRRRFLGPNGYAFGGPAGEYQGTIRTAWESLVLLAHGIEPTRTRAHGRVNRDKLAEIDLHWHDLRHEAACRWLSRGLDLRAIQLLLGHADLKTTQRYLNVTDEELRKTMQQKLWNRK